MHSGLIADIARWQQQCTVRVRHAELDVGQGGSEILPDLFLSSSKNGSLTHGIMYRRHTVQAPSTEYCKVLYIHQGTYELPSVDFVPTFSFLPFLASNRRFEIPFHPCRSVQNERPFTKLATTSHTVLYKMIKNVYTIIRVLRILFLPVQKLVPLSPIFSFFFFAILRIEVFLSGCSRSWSGGIFATVVV